LEKEEKISLTSRKKWLWLGVAIAILNPVFSGLIIGLAFWTEPKLKKEGKVILAVAIIWGIIFSYLLRWLISHGYLPTY
jgi:hypothetical protein